MKTIYRIQTTQGEGLWYKPSGELTALVSHVENARCKDLPMGYDPSISAGNWRSGTQNLDEMREWISHEEIAGLTELGLGLYKVTVSEDSWRMTEEPYRHAVYLDTGLISCELISWDVLYEGQLGATCDGTPQGSTPCISTWGWFGLEAVRFCHAPPRSFTMIILDQLTIQKGAYLFLNVELDHSEEPLPELEGYTFVSMKVAECLCGKCNYNSLRQYVVYKRN